MKSGKITTLLIIFIIVITIVLGCFLQCGNIVPNSDKFVYDLEKYRKPILEDFTPIGDGSYCIDNLRYYLALERRYPRNDPDHYDIILDYIYEYKFENEILYCYSADGYAIIYPESNICKVLITLPDPRMEHDYKASRVEEDDYRISKVSVEKYPENKLIVYLDSFDEYTAYEQKMLNALVEKYNK